MCKLTQGSGEKGTNDQHVRSTTILGIVGGDGEEVRVDRLDVVAMSLGEHALQRRKPLAVAFERIELPVDRAKPHREKMEYMRTCLALVLHDST